MNLGNVWLMGHLGSLLFSISSLNAMRVVAIQEKMRVAPRKDCEGGQISKGISSKVFCREQDSDFHQSLDFCLYCQIFFSKRS